MGKGKGIYWMTLCCLLPRYTSALLSRRTSDDYYFKTNRSLSVHHLLYARVYDLAIKSSGR